jgi:DNA repair protein RecO (recombination protein O)
MLYKTRGIALSYIRYRDTSIIARIYTELFGVQSYIVNGVRSAGARIQLVLFQPLTLLDLVVYHNRKSEIHRIREIKCPTPYGSIPYDMRKTSLALFLSEFLGKLLREEEENSPMFDFVRASLLDLDGCAEGFENFHLQFLLRLAAWVGIAPESAYALAREINSPVSVDEALLGKLEELRDHPYFTPASLASKERNLLLDTVINFYRYHFDQMGSIRSVEVLREVLHGGP